MAQPGTPTTPESTPPSQPPRSEPSDEESKTDTEHHPVYIHTDFYQGDTPTPHQSEDESVDNPLTNQGVWDTILLKAVSESFFRGICQHCSYPTHHHANSASTAGIGGGKIL